MKFVTQEQFKKNLEQWKRDVNPCFFCFVNEEGDRLQDIDDSAENAFQLVDFGDHSKMHGEVWFSIDHYSDKNLVMEGCLGDDSATIGNYITRVHINYCPFCGRKLGKEEKPECLK